MCLKTSVTKCVLSLLLPSTMIERNDWRRLLTYSHRSLHGSIGGMLGNTTLFQLLGTWVTQMQHLPRVAILPSNDAHSYGFWKLCTWWYINNVNSNLWSEVIPDTAGLLQAAEDHAHWVMTGPILKSKYVWLECMLLNSTTMKLVLWPYRKIQTHRIFIPSSGARHRPV